MGENSHLSQKSWEFLESDIELQITRTGYKLTKILGFYGVSKSRWYQWKSTFTTFKIKDKNTRKSLLAPLQEEIDKVLEFRKHHPGVGYRKFTHMLNDADIAFLTESAIYRILKANNVLVPEVPREELQKAAKEYQNKPTHPHHHWHMDIAYIKIRGTFYFLIMMLDGYSRYLLGWELMSDMLGSSVEAFTQRVKALYPDAKPILITDNGCQFVSKDFKTLLQRIDIQHVRTRRNHPETNGKIERLNKSTKHEAIFPNAPQSFLEAVQILKQWEIFYNNSRLHAAINFITPKDKLLGNEKNILTNRKNNVTIARDCRIAANKLNYNLNPSSFLTP